MVKYVCSVLLQRLKTVFGSSDIVSFLEYRVSSILRLALSKSEWPEGLAIKWFSLVALFGRFPWLRGLLCLGIIVLDRVLKYAGRLDAVGVTAYLRIHLRCSR